jgi:RNA polymerase sigma-70 factor (ECF subfamily)
VYEPEPDTVRRAQQGDTEAFEELVVAYLPDVHRWALHVVRDAHIAEDVTQDTFLRAYRALATFRWRSRFSTWLFRITRNCAIEATRTIARQQRMERVRPVERSPTDPTLRVAISDALDGLPHELREVFVAVEVFGFSYREASVILGIPTGTIKSRMHRTRKLLVEALTEEGAGEM